MELSTIVKNTDLNILYIDITKTAGMAITESFQVQFPNYTFEGKHHSIQNFIAHGSDIVDDFGRRLVGTCRVVTQHDLEDLHTFSVIRNPYDRMVSLWLWGCQTECTVAAHQCGKSVVRKDILIWEAYFLSLAFKTAVFFQFDASLADPETENFTKFGMTPQRNSKLSQLKS